MGSGLALVAVNPNFDGMSEQPFANFLQDAHGRQGEQGHDKAAAESQQDAGPGTVMGTRIPQHQAEDERDEG